MAAAKLIIATLVAASIAVPAAIAQSGKTKVVETFRDWTLFNHSSSDRNVCFISSQPREYKPDDYTRQRSHFYVSAWPKDGVKAEISAKFGKPLSDGSEVKIRIGSARYTLFTKGDQAFLEDPAQQPKLINAMRRGREMIVSGLAADGTSIEDVYSPSGVSAGINSLRRTCS